MKPCFADTSYYLALINRSDVNHEIATRLATSLRRRVVTTEFVLLELANSLARGNRQRFETLRQRVEDDPQTILVPAASSILRRGLRLYGERPDKAWSATDCVSFLVMRDLRIRDALTADLHFEQAGYAILMK